LRRLSPGGMAVVLLAAIADRILIGVKWALLLDIVQVRLPTCRAIRHYYESSFVGTFMPTQLGGDVLRVHLAVRDVGAVHPVVASLVMERLMGLLSALNWAILGGGVLMSVVRPEHRAAWLVGSAALVLSVSGLFVLAMMPSVHAFVLRPFRRLRKGWIAATFHSFYDAFAEFSARPGRLIFNGALTFAEQGLQMLVLYLIAHDLGLKVAPIPLFAAIAVYLLVVKVPIAPDGWGLAELTAIGILGLVGIGSSDAFTISLLAHATGVLALSPGLLFLLTAVPPPIEVASGARERK
jgi:uncharacterized protein (TIRG00374 family)